jgi:hypothetical protein
VEQFSKRLVVGWISVPKGSPPVKVTLHLNQLQVAATYATPGNSMSGLNSETRRRAAEAQTSAQPSAQPLVHKWQVPNIPGPDDDRRNSRQEIRTFSFRVREIWHYSNKATKITVRADGQPLPIFGHGTFLSPRRKGTHSLGRLRKKFDDGYLFTQNGRLALSKKLDVEWQQKVMGLYQQVRSILSETHGYDPFFIYGTLLGAIREGGYIGHDIDFDAAYLSRRKSPRAAAAELAEIALILVERGMRVECKYTALHIHHPDDHSARIDLFHTFFNNAGDIQFPFGIAGTNEFTRDDWQGTEEVDFPGGKGLVPVNGEKLVAHLYGDDWRQPKPGFNWNLDRTASAGPASHTTQAQQSKVYWADFYAHNEYTSGSTFFEFVNDRADTPAYVVDIGCGDGRDACAFGAAGRTVVGIDQSKVGIDHATGHAAARGLGERVEFLACDVSDAAGLGTILDEVRLKAGDEPVLFYLRFFLHSITAAVQASLLDTLSARARSGDVFAAEFRTDKDEEQTKVHGKHYRRFQNGPVFGATLAGEHGFEILHEEENTGLSPYQDEDPVLYRVVARRR